jgi:hypothetical protein
MPERKSWRTKFKAPRLNFISLHGRWIDRGGENAVRRQRAYLWWSGRESRRAGFETRRARRDGHFFHCVK